MLFSTASLRLKPAYNGPGLKQNIFFTELPLQNHGEWTLTRFKNYSL